MLSPAGIVRSAAAATIASCVVFIGHAGAQDRSAAAWRELTRGDVQAAHDIIARNHPGAAPATGDSAFRQALFRGLEAAIRRTGEIGSYEGWLATMRAFAVSFDDPHIALQPRLALQVVRWPGFVTGRQGDATLVAARDSSDATLPALGTRLVSCDGEPIEALGRARLGAYRGTWDIAAQRVRNTPLLLVDDGNPFVAPPTRCVVAENGVERTVELTWRSTSPANLQPYLRRATAAGRSGFGVRRVGPGWWIGIESLNDRVQAVLDSVDAHLGDIRNAPWVVVDVRGNSGGSSEWGRRLGARLVGDERANGAERRLNAAAQTDGRCGGSWRASADVLETIEGYIRNLGPRLGDRATDQWRQEREAVRAALGAGRELAPEPRTCSPTSRSMPSTLPPSAMSGRLVLLTDHVCFSSCLLLTPLFREIGALHVGEGTDFSTRYMEVRAFPLPSGLGQFSTLQRVSFSTPARLGPFDPEVPFPGRMDDTPALEAWIRSLMER